MKPSNRSLLTAALPPVVLFLVVLGVWQAVVRIWKVPAFLLPSPTDIGNAALENFGKLASATGITAAGAACGFGVSLTVGVLIALVFSQSAIIRRSFFPYAILLQTVPIVAIAPLIVLWSGTGFRSVVLVAFIVSVFPIITNATAGLTAIDPDLVDLFRLHNASRWQTLLKLRLPSAVPSTVTGAKTSSGLAVIGTIVGEFFVGYDPSEHYGLGYLIQESTTQLKVDLVLCAVVLATVLGLLVFGAVNLVGALVLRRFSSTG
jgi:NitT/TauT family transport system permease protein